MAIIVVDGGVAIGKALISNFFAWIFAEAKLLDAQTTDHGTFVGPLRRSILFLGSLVVLTLWERGFVAL